MNIRVLVALFLAFLAFPTFRVIAAEAGNLLIDLRTEELLDEFSRFPERAKKMYKGKAFRFTGRIAEIKTDEGKKEFYVRFDENSKRQVHATLHDVDPEFIRRLSVGHELTFTAVVVIGGMVTDGRFVVLVENYSAGVPLARPVEPLKTQVEIDRALRVIQVGQPLRVSEINSVFGKPFDEKIEQPGLLIYKWMLGKHLLTIQFNEGKIFMITQQQFPTEKWKSH